MRHELLSDSNYYSTHTSCYVARIKYKASLLPSSPTKKYSHWYDKRLRRTRRFVCVNMGNPVAISNLDTNGLDEETLRCIKAVKDLSPSNIKTFFEQLFSGMSLVAKETVVDLLWATMTMREQHLFDLPTTGRRISDEEVLRNLGSSELNVMPRRIIRGLQQAEPSLISRSLRSRTGITQVWPRIGYNRALETNAEDSMSAPEIESVTPETGWRRSVPNSHQTGHGDMGDHILNLLMDVVMRAEQSANSSTARGATGSAQHPESEHSARRSRQ